VGLIAAGVRPCLPQETITLPGGVGMTFSHIPPGSFLMGSNHPEGCDDEKPVHRVNLTKGFFLGTHQVTQAQWKAINGATPSIFKGANRPVENVSWVSGALSVYRQKQSGNTRLGRGRRPSSISGMSSPRIWPTTMGTTPGTGRQKVNTERAPRKSVRFPRTHGAYSTCMGIVVSGARTGMRPTHSITRLTPSN